MTEENWAENESVEETSDEATAVAGDAEPEAATPALERTGNSAVDEVLESVESLDQVPVAEQVAVFEAAHEKLRAALADAGNEPDA